MRVLTNAQPAGSAPTKPSEFQWAYSISNGPRSATCMYFSVTNDPMIGRSYVNVTRSNLTRGWFSKDWSAAVDQRWSFNDDRAKVVAQAAIDALSGWTALQSGNRVGPEAWERPDTRSVRTSDGGYWSYSFNEDIPNNDKLGAVHDMLTELAFGGGPSDPDGPVGN